MKVFCLGDVKVIEIDNFLDIFESFDKYLGKGNYHFIIKNVNFALQDLEDLTNDPQSNYNLFGGNLFKSNFYFTFLNEVNIEYETKELFHLIKNCNFKKNIYIYTNEITYNHCIFNKEIKFINDSSEEYYFDDCYFNHIVLSGNNKININYGPVYEYLNGGNIWTFEFKGHLNIYGGPIAELTSLVISNSISNDLLSLFNIKINNLKILNSKVGKSIFSGIEIGDLEIKGTNLTEVSLNNIVFNNYKLQEICSIDNPDVVDNKLMKDCYRQLKYIMDNNANYTEANKFYALEMEYYGKSLKWLSKDFFYKLIHQFQLYTSNFGDLWILCILWIILIAVISNILNYHYILYKYNFVIDWKLNFINLISPFYGLGKNEINNIQSDLYIYSGFILYKTIYGILIYQLIIALKRTTKR